MRKTQFAAFLLSGLLVLNTAIPAFAEGMTQQRENAQTYAVPDTEAPKVTEVTVDKAEVTAPGKVTVTVKAEDKIGVSKCFVEFVNKETGREIYKSSSRENPLSIEFNISEYEANGLFELSAIRIEDKIGNERIYSGETGEALPKPIPSFKVINKDDELVPGESDDELVPGESDEELVPGQSENRPNKPQRPSKPSHSGSSSGAVVNYDSEKPDPADKKAMEMYNFWQNVKRKIKNTEEGKTLRVAVPAEYTYMPASVMETLRLNPQVSLKLSWGKDTIVIKAGTAQPKQKLKAYWTKSALLKLYTQR